MMAVAESTMRVTVGTGYKVPVKDWVNHDLDDKVTEQMSNLAKLPFALKHVALMPDAHAGIEAADEGFGYRIILQRQER